MIRPLSDIKVYGFKNGASVTEAAINIRFVYEKCPDMPILSVSFGKIFFFSKIPFNLDDEVLLILNF